MKCKLCGRDAPEWSMYDDVCSLNAVMIASCRDVLCAQLNEQREYSRKVEALMQDAEKRGAEAEFRFNGEHAARQTAVACHTVAVAKLAEAERESDELKARLGNMFDVSDALDIVNTRARLLHTALVEAQGRLIDLDDRDFRTPANVQVAGILAGITAALAQPADVADHIVAHIMKDE